jgi:ornithine cyclodeaminase/alanine dehydrogenase-like protein (mu-crystallin family)
MSASAEYLNLVGWKNYTTTRSGAHFHVAVYDTQTGAMEALIEADRLGQLRTGAASGVATKYLAVPEAARLGVIGTGWQARSQVAAVCAVRPIESVEVYSRDAERRERFAAETASECHVEVRAVDSANAAVSEKDVVITATSSREPVFDGEVLAPGTHVNAIGSNHLKRAEIDVATVRRSAVIVCDSVEQCHIEAGDFVAALEEDALRWDQVLELSDVVDGRFPSRTSPEQITLFESLGLALEDVAMAGELIRRAREQGRGEALEIDSAR